MVGVGIALFILLCCCCCGLYWWLRSDRDGLSAARSGLAWGKFAVVCERCSCCGRSRSWAPPVLPLHYRFFPRPEYMEPVLPTFSPPRRPFPLLPLARNPYSTTSKILLFNISFFWNLFSLMYLTFCQFFFTFLNSKKVFVAAIQKPGSFRFMGQTAVTCSRKYLCSATMSPDVGAG